MCHPVVSLILPAYNEGLALPQSIADTAAMLKEIGVEYEIIVSDDGSTDCTSQLPWSELASSHGVRYIKSPCRKGKGHAVKSAMKVAAGRYIIFTDADIPVSLDSVTDCINSLVHGDADVVIGNRRAAQSRRYGRSLMRRKVASWVFNRATRCLALPGLPDTQCCLKGFSNEALHKVIDELRMFGYAMDVELIFLLRRAGYEPTQIPVTWTDKRRRVPLFRLVWEVLSAIMDVAKMRVLFLTRG